MSSRYKAIISRILFLCAYMHLHYVCFIFGSQDKIWLDYDFIIILILFIIIVCIGIETKDITAVGTTFVFMIAIGFYFFLESLVIGLHLYSIGNSGGYIRNNILGDIKYQFNWYEILFWNFIFSMHYPLYYFLIINPSVNYIDKSIKKDKL